MDLAKMMAEILDNARVAEIREGYNTYHVMICCMEFYRQ
jgi:hypothetical protein